MQRKWKWKGTWKEGRKEGSNQRRKDGKLVRPTVAASTVQRCRGRRWYLEGRKEGTKEGRRERRKDETTEGLKDGINGNRGVKKPKRR